MTATGEFDLADPGLLFRDDVLDEPAALYTQLRRDAPVWELPGTSTFVVSSAELVAEAVGRPDDFSSNLTSLVYRGDDGSTRVFDMTPLGDATHVLATADAPIHTRHRKLLQPSFAPGRVDGLEESVTTLVDRLIDPLVADGGGDVVEALADPLPMQVIGDLIGIPRSDASMLVQLVLDVDRILAGVSNEAAMAEAAGSAVEQAVYLGGLLQQTIDRPRDARGEVVLAVLADAIASDEITFDEAVGMLTQLLGAGTETTTGLISTGVRMLATDLGLQDRLRADVTSIPTFVEEVLRLDGPFRFHYRAAVRTSRLGGVEIPTGSRVLLMWAAANLDTDAQENATVVDLDRPHPKGHLAFGRGMHFCIGAPLARLEARVAFRRLLERTDAIGLDATRPPRHHRNIFLRRLERLDVVLR